MNNDVISANRQWCEKKSSFFSHKECEAFPCHATDDKDNFNCLFCFCPLYMFGRQCGGNFTHTLCGIMDCTNCMIPHERDSYGYVIQKLKELRGISRHEKESEK